MIDVVSWNHRGDFQRRFLKCEPSPFICFLHEITEIVLHSSLSEAQDVEGHVHLNT